MSTTVNTPSIWMRVVVLSCLLSCVAMAQVLPSTNHSVTKEQAIKYIENFKISPAATVITIKGGAFNRDIVDKILSQSGCVGIRLYYANLDNGNPTMVMVGVNAEGDDMSEGTIAQAILPCPPICGSSANTLAK